MRLIVGLGNPGPEHTRTRHNAGFWFVDSLAERLGVRFGVESKLFGETAKVDIGGRTVWLLKPSTYMAMTKRQKAIKAAVEPGKSYAIDEALKIVQSNSKSKFNEAVDVAVRLGVDAKKSDQQVRGSTVLPAGTGKSVRVAVFAPAGAKADEALAAGAEAVGMTAWSPTRSSSCRPSKKTNTSSPRPTP